MEKDSITRICLWSGPRNISTTLMYSFAQRNDTLVFDEPLYAHYLSNTNANKYHPGAEEILSSMENDGEKVIEMMLGNHDKSVLFFKNMTHHLLNLDFSFMKNVVNVILTRDPIEMLPSFDKVIKNPSIDDVGYEMQTKLVDYFQKNNIKYIVLDSKKVLINPKDELRNLCNSIGIPFDDHMLHWKAEARKEDGLWAEYWYKNIHKSTGFIAYKPKTTPFPNHLKPLLNDCFPQYQKLLELI
jgi:hypothetical protein